MLKKYDYTSILGWSVSRYDKFLACKRQYYYDYYAKYDPSYSRQKIDKLKKMTSIALEIGNIVHDINKVFLERLLVSEEQINRDRFFDYTHKKTQEYCNAKTFSEIYYKKAESIDIDDIFATVKMSLLNFIDSERCDWIMKKAVENKKDWIIEPPGYGETRINKMKAYCKVDFLFPVDGRFYILDWKTGKVNGEKHRKQLIGYSAWASAHFDITPDKITPIIVYLKPDYKELTVDVNEADIKEFSEVVKEETKEMHSFCSNIEENIPIDKETFVMTDNRRICNYCNYRELCKV